MIFHWSPNDTYCSLSRVRLTFTYDNSARRKILATYIQISFYVVEDTIRQETCSLENLTTVRKMKFKWYGHVTRASNIFITILQGTTIGKRRKKMICWPMKCNKKQKQISFAKILLRNIFCIVKELNVLQKKSKTLKKSKI